jgi:ubiquinone biosynthesis monooxygenase Coq7
MAEGFEKSAENAPWVVVLRPQLRHEQIAFRGRTLTADQRKKIRKALRTLHTLEIMAVCIYRYQIGRPQTELNRELIAAMCNEMTHAQDFQVKLYEYGLTPGLFRWAWWLAGCALGTASRLLGPAAVLKTGVWVETKAVHHYAQLLDVADWDEPARAVIVKNQADESGHIQTWKRLLADMTSDKTVPNTAGT